jgi:hypothetical protein
VLSVFIYHILLFCAKYYTQSFTYIILLSLQINTMRQNSWYLTILEMIDVRLPKPS